MPSGLLPRLDDVWFENFAAWARAHPQGRVETRGGWRIASLRSPWPFYNVATAVSEGFGDHPGVVAELADAFAADAGYRVWLRDGMDLAEASLRIAGYESTDEIPASWMRLTKVPRAAVPKGYRLIRGESDDEVIACMLGERWEGYMDDEQVTATFPEPARMAAEGDRGFYLAYQDDLLVATGQTIALGGVVGVQGMWTAEEHRRKGIAAAMLAIALKDAAKAGNKFAHIQASEAGAGIYQRAGFKEYGRYRIYRPPSPY